MNIRNRVKELRTVKASELRPSPHNWRTHPQAQQDALRGVLAEMGYADALLVRECEDGVLELIDGHLRAEATPDTEVPVLVLDVDEQEAKYILATLDPLAGLADTDNESLRKLLDSVAIDNEAVRAMCDAVMGDGDAPEDAEPSTAPELGDLEYRIIIDCRDEMHQVEMLDRFEKEGVECRALIS